MQQTHSPEHWCKVRLGVSAATAARLVRCAQGLVEFPRVASAFGEGRLSVDHVDVIVTSAHPMYDKELAESNGGDAEDDERHREPSVVAPVDALHRLVHAALDGLDPNVAAGRRPGDRTQVILHVDADHPERSHLHLGPALPTSIRRQLLCDADVRLAIRRDGKVVASGRRRRTVDVFLRMVIEDRDQGCRVQGCDKRGFLHVHHLVHWEDGGPTDPHNLCCLCPEHHRMVHAGLIKLIGDPETPDGLITLDRHGRPLPRSGDWPLPAELPTPPSTYRGTYWGQRAQYN